MMSLLLAVATMGCLVRIPHHFGAKAAFLLTDRGKENLSVCQRSSSTCMYMHINCCQTTEVPCLLHPKILDYFGILTADVAA